MGDDDDEFIQQQVESIPNTNNNDDVHHDDPKHDDEGENVSNQNERDPRNNSSQLPKDLPVPSSPPYSARVDNLDYSVNDEELKEIFREHQMKYAGISYDKVNRRSRGFGVIEFETAEDLRNALLKNGTEVKGRAIEVFVKPPFQQSSNKPAKRYDKNQNKRYGRGGPDTRTKEKKSSDREGFSQRGGKKGGPTRGGGKANNNMFGKKNNQQEEKKEVSFISTNPFDLLMEDN